MRVLIAGGTGFVGRSLVLALASRGDEVVVFSRSPGGQSLDGRVRHARWDARSADAALPEIVRADVVVNLAGAPVLDEPWTPERLALLRSSRVDSTRALAEAIARAEPRPRAFVAGSAVGIYGMRDDARPFDEDGEHGDDELATLCEAWEAATAPASNAGVRVAIARIGVVLGKDGGALAKMLGPFKWFVGGAVGSGTQPVAWVHEADAARALLFAIDDERMKGPFNVAAPSGGTMNDLARAVGAALGRPSLFKVPAFALRAALGEDRARVLLTGQRAVPKKLEGLGFTFVHDDLRAAVRELVA